jgi:hypothetical protein
MTDEELKEKVKKVFWDFAIRQVQRTKESEVKNEVCAK